MPPRHDEDEDSDGGEEGTFGNAQAQEGWFENIQTGKQYGWNWSSNTSKNKLNHTQIREFIYTMEDVHKNLNSIVDNIDFFSGFGIGLLSKSFVAGATITITFKGVDMMSGSITDAFNALGRAYNALDTQSGLYLITKANSVTTMGTGMYISSVTTTFYKPTGELFAIIRY